MPHLPTLRASVPRTLALAAAALCAAGAAAPLAGQADAPDLRAEATAGSEAERYLRVLQVAGLAPLYPWSVRAFSPAEVDRLVPRTAAHPWAARLRPAGGLRADSTVTRVDTVAADTIAMDTVQAGSAPAGAAAPRAVAAPERGMRVRLLRPAAALGFNSAFPQGGNDGAVWAGRGLTTWATAGVHLRAGPLSVRLEPVAFWTQNQTFDLVPNLHGDSLPYRSPHAPSFIDFPQRFGDGAFARVDPGQSTIRLDVRGVALGVSTANEVWGPAVDQPLLLGTNAAGMPRAFVGTSTPWNVWIGRLHARIVWGSLAQSEYSPMPEGHGSRRLGTGLTLSLTPARLDGLELGISRFFHEPWPAGGLSFGKLARPLGGLFREGVDESDEGKLNQLLSVHARWVLPRAGLEFYGEFSREDHNFDLLDFLMEPDRSSGYLLGGRSVWGSGTRLRSLRAEWVNTQPSHLEQASNQANNMYRHRGLMQGHTFGGQLLGSLAGYGGGGSVVALDVYTPRGRWSVDWTRTRLSSPRTVLEEDYGVDVLHSLGGEAVLFRGRMDLVAALRGSLQMNRFAGEDAFNLSASLGARVGL